MGPWSSRCAPSLRLPSVFGQKAHSVTLKPSRPIPAECAFAMYTNVVNCVPEIYPRPDGEVYVHGFNYRSVTLPKRAADVKPTRHACERTAKYAGGLCARLRGAEVVTATACFMPLTVDSLPLMGRVPGVDGAFVSAGHGCWGILESPAAGKSMAELLLEGRSRCLNLKPYDPIRLLRHLYPRRSSRRRTSGAKKTGPGKIVTKRG
jgi:glycine/D-amino acid oxidase-like deaminating enzyme